VKPVAHGLRSGEERVRLEFQASIDAEESYNAVLITGISHIEAFMKGGVNGDLAAAAMVVNSIPRVIDTPPGLVTMKDLPIVCTPPKV
jgi:hypothetical protein